MIRILKPQGRDEGCVVSYSEDQKINYFRAWTIAPDEKTYQAQPTDFVDVGDTSVPVMLSTDKARVARPPAIDVGATLVCESEELMAPYAQEKMWMIQNTNPVVFQALEIDLPEGEDISQKGDNTCSEIGQENSEHHAKHYSDARFPWVARQPAGQRQGKNGEQRQQCKFCERCAESQDNSLPIDRLFATVAFLEKIDETVRTGRSGTAPSKPSPI